MNKKARTRKPGCDLQESYLLYFGRSCALTQFTTHSIPPLKKNSLDQFGFQFLSTAVKTLTHLGQIICMPPDALLYAFQGRFDVYLYDLYDLYDLAHVAGWEPY